MSKYKEALETLCEAITQRKNFVIKLAIGNLNELVEKATPKKYGTKTVKSKSFEDCEFNIIHAVCPACGEIIDEFEYYAGCPYCLQAIDWSEEDDC